MHLRQHVDGLAAGNIGAANQPCHQAADRQGEKGCPQSYGHAVHQRLIGHHLADLPGQHPDPVIQGKVSGFDVP